MCEWIKRLHDIRTIEYHSATTMNELSIHTVVRRNLKGIVLSERNYFQIVIYCMILRMWHPGEKKANRVLPREHTVIANTLFQKHKRQWTSADGQYQNQIDYVPCSLRWRSSIQSAKTRPGVDCSSDHELLIAKIRLKLRKVGKTTRPFRYDLNKIP